MTSKKISTRKLQELDEALEFAYQVDKKLQEFNFSSAQVAEKWQKKVEKNNQKNKY
jgi:tRNA U54 and U55 pseudouridine synthase Pus10